ncbi:aspartate/glutamate racemase family protein [Microaceticoccus formicicus]|uniref:aspartate/glutamate racemase family protein n=1 Tax=Microaceticoccus formicicus TaxID=3118105 RepID=UPI003CCFFA28|nr:aspartate/glutamate racemase family protein [Peptoniphilaceae bacterium AMB_02]
MKTIGLIGGMSWESTATYYRIINQTVKEKLGGLHSAKILLYSADFEEIEKYQANNDWEKSGQVLGEIAKKLESAGAEFIVICTNTMHKVLPQIEEYISIPIIHIADATAEVLIEENIKKVGLLGTKYTMTQDFYKSRVIDKGIDVIVPTEEDTEIINYIIYNELCLGIIKPGSLSEYQRIIKTLESQGAQGIILGCTEIGLLISQKDSSLPLFDTTYIHSEKAALFALE